MRRYPAAAHWIDAEPITDVAVMGGIEDRRREFVVDGEPVVTGLVAVGDAWACTNPSLGRGRLDRRAARRRAAATCSPRKARPTPTRWCAGSPRRPTRGSAPYLEATLSFDRHRLAEIEADVAGVPYRPDDRGWAMATARSASAPGRTRAGPRPRRRRGTAGDTGRGVRRSGARERVLPWVGRPWLTPGPDRAELLEVLAAT